MDSTETDDFNSAHTGGNFLWQGRGRSESPKLDVQSRIPDRIRDPSKIPEVGRNTKQLDQGCPDVRECLDIELDCSLTLQAVKRQCNRGAPNADRISIRRFDPNSGTRRFRVE